ncbi:hypothetical protein [Micromonospora sp. WMMD710]|uniref:hypothetical protein n=1 Tax=Micromonospora sp. WMMD710 TaxID=3016085 RepID=UPI002417FCBB|nr:hypothetical protein [Micromonospora sp. WMMD710]MDG4759001.1 hypothetical protein [Micromonospora sp. WMMD710]
MSGPSAGRTRWLVTEHLLRGGVVLATDVLRNTRAIRGSWLSTWQEVRPRPGA